MRRVRIYRDFTILNSMRDLYETNEEVVRMGIKRHCYCCGHDFVLGDKVSILVTDRGNKALCGTCFDEVA